MNIVGPGPSALTVASNRSGSYGIFTVLSGAKVAISGLTITGGSVLGAGGGIENSGMLSIANDVISGNVSAAVLDNYGVAQGSTIPALYRSLLPPLVVIPLTRGAPLLVM